MVECPVHVVDAPLVDTFGLGTSILRFFFDKIFVIFHRRFSYMFNKISSYVIRNTSMFDCTSIIL